MILFDQGLKLEQDKNVHLSEIVLYWKIVNVMLKFERIARYILNEVETGHYLISIRLYIILTILITEDGSQPYFF
jgi:hypothetical protein